MLSAVKVTRGLQTRLCEAATGSALTFGGMWTVVIVAQVAATVAFPFTAFAIRRDAIGLSEMDVGFASEEYLTARLELDRATAGGVPADTAISAFRHRLQNTWDELERRLAADPAVLGVTFGDRLPRSYHPHRIIEVDGGGAAPLNPNYPPGYRVSSASVAPDFFLDLGVSVTQGRAFHTGDIESDHRVVIVNQSFVKLVLGNRNPIGRRIRYRYFEGEEPVEAETQPWYEIVGVVRDLGMAREHDPKVAGFYHPASPAAAYPLQLAIHIKGDPQAFAPRLREIAGAFEPGIRLHNPIRMDRVDDHDVMFLSFWFRLVLAVSGVALLLSLAGIYSVTAFTVAKRTREIGVRVALGASSQAVVLAILVRPVKQVAFGILAGGVVIAFLMGAIDDISVAQALAIISYALAMMVVCMLACIVPTRRALRVQPTIALRAQA